MSTNSAELESERAYVAGLYRRLDALRAAMKQGLSRAMRDEYVGTAQAKSERDTAAGMYADRLAQVKSVEERLCFGRLDYSEGETHYIGRMGIFDEDSDYEPLLMDWRAPAARPFYTATAWHNEGVARRRQFRTHRRDVVDLRDEVLDSGSEFAAHGDGESALLAALQANRTGRMSDIVATIQSEQDEAIRAEGDGVLVVDGGPGTGKTAVALHRAAYLLYTHRQRLSRRGVLIVGPNTTFLRYVSDVLPSLGETQAVFATVGELYPGVIASGTEQPVATRAKGGLGMVDVLRKAVADRQEPPEGGIEVFADDALLQVSEQACLRARDRARATGLPHNPARRTFYLAFVDEVTACAAEALGADLLTEEDTEALRQDLTVDPGVRDAVERLWPALTARQLLADLFRSADLLASAAPQLSDVERATMLLPEGDDEPQWTEADVPLLDEAEEFLGVDDTARRRKAAEEQRAEREYAAGVLNIVEIDRAEEADEEQLLARDVINAAVLAQRAAAPELRTLAERAIADRTWTFGHVIVDEAQDLSPMAWRLLMRRCPSRSMTIVGDQAQTTSAGGASGWAAVLEPFVADRWRLHQLTVNYRVPAEVMDVAARVLAEVAPHQRPPESARETGLPPGWRQLDPAELVPAIVAETGGEGTLAVLAPPSLVDQILAEVPGAAAELDAPVTVLTPARAKGLEFDRVILVEPARIVAESDRGASELYVALTRPTQRLLVLHHEPLPAFLAKLPAQASS